MPPRLAPVPAEHGYPVPSAAADCPADGFRADCESQTGTRVSDCRTAGVPGRSGPGSASVNSSVAHGGGTSLRRGGRNGAPQRNRGSDDAPLPEQSPDGVSMSRPLPVNTWTCAEFRADGSTGRLGTWTGGTAVQGLAVDGSRVGC
jgi:hypothetical protein